MLDDKSEFAKKLATEMSKCEELDDIINFIKSHPTVNFDELTYIIRLLGMIKLRMLVYSNEAKLQIKQCDEDLIKLEELEKLVASKI